jgi:hypothetical protein
VPWLARYAADRVRWYGEKYRRAYPDLRIAAAALVIAVGASLFIPAWLYSAGRCPSRKTGLGGKMFISA